MTFNPSRGLGLALGTLLLTLLLGASVLSLIQLGSASISGWMLLWVALPLAGVPLAALIGYRLHGLLMGSYRLDRDGFYLTWGPVREQIPLQDISGLELGRDLPAGLRPTRGLWWPGCVVGRRSVEGVGPVEFFATTGASGMVLVSAGGHHWAISPRDPEAFLQTFRDSVRMGSLEPISRRSQRPDLVIDRVWSDRWARGLILAGIAAPILLLAYLAVQASTLPPQVPIRFDASGAPMPLAPAGRLLLLPMIGGLCWAADLVLGTWMYRREENRRIAYALWVIAILVGFLMWGAVLQLLAAAPQGPHSG